MKRWMAITIPAGVLILLSLLPVAAGGGTGNKGKQDVSFAIDVFPVIRKHCLPCHAEESFNPSELSLDTYELLMKGGEHGPALKPGKPEESLLILKLADSPPFGDRMPIPRRRRSAEPPKKLSDEEIRILTEWIKQGAVKN